MLSIFITEIHYFKILCRKLKYYEQEKDIVFNQQIESEINNKEIELNDIIKKYQPTCLKVFDLDLFEESII